jgi:hypothetical protein
LPALGNVFDLAPVTLVPVETFMDGTIAGHSSSTYMFTSLKKAGSAGKV